MVKRYVLPVLLLAAACGGGGAGDTPAVTRSLREANVGFRDVQPHQSRTGGGAYDAMIVRVTEQDALSEQTAANKTRQSPFPWGQSLLLLVGTGIVHAIRLGRRTYLLSVVSTCWKSLVLPLIGLLIFLGAIAGMLNAITGPAALGAFHIAVGMFVAISLPGPETSPKQNVLYAFLLHTFRVLHWFNDNIYDTLQDEWTKTELQNFQRLKLEEKHLRAERIVYAQNKQIWSDGADAGQLLREARVGFYCHLRLVTVFGHGKLEEKHGRALKDARLTDEEAMRVGRWNGSERRGLQLPLTGGRRAYDAHAA